MSQGRVFGGPMVNGTGRVADDPGLHLLLSRSWRRTDAGAAGRAGWYRRWCGSLDWTMKRMDSITLVALSGAALIVLITFLAIWADRRRR